LLTLTDNVQCGDRDAKKSLRWYDQPAELRSERATLLYFSIMATVGTPTAIAAHELRVEGCFPADEARASPSDPIKGT
jgi:hypothetical protein